MNQISATSPDRIVAFSSQLYHLLLAAYPRRFRDEYAQEMVIVFRDTLREACRGGTAARLIGFWLSTLMDLVVTAIEERLADGSGLRRYLRGVITGLIAGVVGGLVAGLGARLAMRGVVYASGLRPAFTLEGTFVILVVCVVLGIPGGLAFVALRRFLPGAGLWQGLSYGVLLFVIFLAPPFLFYREGEATLASPLVTVLLFGPITLAYGLAVQFTVTRLERRDDSARPLTATGLPSALSQGLWFVAFAVLLELAVLGTASILNHSPRIPPGVVRALGEAHIPFALARDGNVWLVSLTALGYFGLSGLIFWQRTRSPMSRFTAITLLLFGGALFNTGATYYAGLMHDVTTLQTVFSILQVAGATCLLSLLYVFPNGRFTIPWTRPLAALWSAWAVAWAAAPALWPESVTLTILALFLITGVAAQVQRYRQLITVEERRQTRWAVAGFAGAVAGFALITVALALIPDLRLPRVSGLSMTATFSLYMLPWLCIPLSISWAMRRHQLWAT